jgi:aryl-alcohol dehydrogenase-like predicted oxidoreductase
MQAILLGTAQWGMNYGITNATGRLSDEAIVEVSAAARAAGITCLDTAPTYGDAEDRIRLAGPDFSVQTKVAAGGKTVPEIVIGLRQSLERMAVKRVTSCLVHDWSVLDASQRRVTTTALNECLAMGLTDRIGVSAYTAGDLGTALAAFSNLGIVQVPVSVLDQRLDGSPQIAALRASGVSVQARSIFLQGLALAAPDRSPFGQHDDLERLRRTALERGLDRVDLCLGYVRSREWIDEVVVAATSVHELGVISEAFESHPPDVSWHTLASTDQFLVDPRRWTESN